MNNLSNVFNSFLANTVMLEECSSIILEIKRRSEFIYY